METLKIVKSIRKMEMLNFDEFCYALFSFLKKIHKVVDDVASS
jgi:hypothetical protein